MLKRKLISIFIFMVLVSSAFAGATQDSPLPFDVPNGVKDTVSGAYGIPNVLIQNDYNMFYAPGTMLKYGTAYGEIWQGNPWGGASFKLPMGLKALVFLGRGYSGTLSGNYASSVNGARGMPGVVGPILGVQSTNGGFLTLSPNFSAITPQHSFDLLLGKKIGTMGFGFKYSLFYNSQLDEQSVSDSPAANTNNGTLRNSKLIAEHHFTLGLTMDKVLIFESLDIAADITFSVLNIKYTEERVNMKKNVEKSLISDGLPTFNILARPIMKVGDNATLVSLLSFSLEDSSSTYQDRADLNNDGKVETLAIDKKEDYVFKDKTTGIVALAALHTKPLENLKLIYSAGCSFSLRDQENTHQHWSTNTYDATFKTTTLQFPLGVSMEYAFNKNIVSRFGVVKYVYESQTTEGTDKTLTGAKQEYSVAGTLPQNSTSSFRITAGLGFKIKDFDIDLALATTTYSFTGIVTGASVKYHY